MDSPKFRNYPCSSWMLIYGKTIEKPGNGSAEHIGLQEGLWGRGSDGSSAAALCLTGPAEGLGSHWGLLAHGPIFEVNE